MRLNSKRYGYWPSFLIAQSCLEKGYGIPSYRDIHEIELLLAYNNMVGIRAELFSNSWVDKTVWKGDIIVKTKPEEIDGEIFLIKSLFRAYHNIIEESFVDSLLFIRYESSDGDKPKYGQDALKIKDPATLVKEISERGYAAGVNTEKIRKVK